MEPVAKCAPFTVRLKLPTEIEVGVTLAICGVGLSSVTALLPVFVESAVSVAEMVKAFAVGGNSGAV